jgi:hypothetical protein
MSKSSSTNYPKAYLLLIYTLLFILSHNMEKGYDLVKSMEPIGRVFTSSHLEQRS